MKSKWLSFFTLLGLGSSVMGKSLIQDYQDFTFGGGGTPTGNALSFSQLINGGIPNLGQVTPQGNPIGGGILLGGVFPFNFFTDEDARNFGGKLVLDANGKWVTRKIVCLNYTKTETNCEYPSEGGIGSSDSNGKESDGSTHDKELNSSSFIDNMTFNDIHHAYDYRFSSSSSCSTCSGGSSSDEVYQHQILRYHGYRWATQPSSLGPGQFLNTDITLTLFKDPDGKGRVDLFDPSLLNTVRFFQSGTTYKDSAHQSVKNLKFYDVSGNATGEINDAVSGVITTRNESKFTFEVFSHDDGVTRAGRLVSSKDPRGFGYTITHAHAIGDTVASADMFWKINTLTDSHNKAFSFTYNTEQKMGSWVVSQIDCPNGNSIKYNFGAGLDGNLDSVDFPDATQTTIARVPDGDFTRVDYFEAAAKGNRKSSTFLTNNFISLGAANADGVEYFNQASMLANHLLNGDKEVIWTGIQYEGHAMWRLIYEGGGALKFTNISEAKYAKTWSITDATLGSKGLTRTYEDTFSYSPYWHYSANRRNRPNELTKRDGSFVKFEYNSDDSMTRKMYSDGSAERWQRNTFQQATRYEDRLGRVTYNTYDSVGNLTERKVGYQMSTGAQNGTVGNEVSGLNYKYYEGSFDVLPDFATLSPIKEGTVSNAEFNEIDRTNQFAVDFTGSILIENAGDYLFTTGSDDGSKLYINGIEVVNNDGLHGYTEVTSLATTLTAGKHDIRISFFEKNGAEKLKVFYQGADTADTKLQIPSEVLTHIVTETERSEAQTTDYAVHTYQYYPVGHANENLVQYETDANGNRTEYLYDSNNYLITVIEPDDQGTGFHTAKSFTYDAAGRLKTSTDAVGRITETDYDNCNRLIKTTFNDDSTETFEYGTGKDSNLITLSKDRNNNYSKFEYDNSGRTFRTTQAFGSVDAVEIYTTYRTGTSRASAKETAGELSVFDYDYRLRRITRTIFTNASTALVNSTIYKKNLLFSTIDAYGRKNYSLYRASDSALIRRVQGTLPSFSLSDYNAVAALNRDLSANAAYIITDFERDEEGQTVATIDGRGIRSETHFDSRGRPTKEIAAAGTLVETVSETLYDAQSNRIEIRSPRYFSEGIAPQQ